MLSRGNQCWPYYRECLRLPQPPPEECCWKQNPPLQLRPGKNSLLLSHFIKMRWKKPWEITGFPRVLKLKDKLQFSEAKEWIATVKRVKKEQTPGHWRSHHSPPGRHQKAPCGFLAKRPSVLPRHCGQHGPVLALPNPLKAHIGPPIMPQAGRTILLWDVCACCPALQLEDPLWDSFNIPVGDISQSQRNFHPHSRFSK